MATENTNGIVQDSKIHSGLDIDAVDDLNKELSQALALIHLISEQYEGAANRYNDQIMSNAMWAVQSRIRSALDVVEGQS